MSELNLNPLTEFNAEIVQKPLNGLLTNLNREIGA
jgi:hypothetical protein